MHSLMYRIHMILIISIIVAKMQIQKIQYTTTTPLLSQQSSVRLVHVKWMSSVTNVKRGKRRMDRMKRGSLWWRVMKGRRVVRGWNSRHGRLWCHSSLKKKTDRFTLNDAMWIINYPHRCYPLDTNPVYAISWLDLWRCILLQYDVSIHSIWVVPRSLILLFCPRLALR